MSGHTPGPWRMAGVSIVRSAEKRVAATTPGGMLSSERLANARLIAAAPDLLKAAKMAREHLIALGSDGTSSGLDAAIAKAEGRS